MNHSSFIRFKRISSKVGKGFGAEEVEFLDTLAGQAAMAIHHSQLYRQSQQQTEALRHAHKIKDEFLKVVSNELKSPLNVIAGRHSLCY